MYEPWRPKGFSVLVDSSRLHMLWVYGHYKCCNSSRAGAVSRRQNPTSTDGPRTERVNPLSAMRYALIFIMKNREFHQLARSFFCVRCIRETYISGYITVPKIFEDKFTTMTKVLRPTTCISNLAGLILAQKFTGFELCSTGYY